MQSFYISAFILILADRKRTLRVTDYKVQQQLHTGASSSPLQHEIQCSTWLCLPAVGSGGGRLWETITQLHHMVNSSHHNAAHLDSCTVSVNQSVDLTHCCVCAIWRLGWFIFRGYLFSYYSVCECRKGIKLPFSFAFASLVMCLNNSTVIMLWFSFLLHTIHFPRSASKIWHSAPRCD